MESITKHDLVFLCCKYIDGKLWFPSYEGNNLFCYENGKVINIGTFPDKYAIALYFDMQYYNERLIFIPHVKTPDIIIYDIKSQQFSSVPLYINVEHLKSLFGSSFIWNDNLYMFPTYYPGILKVNLINGEVKIINEWVNEIEKFNTVTSDLYCGYDFVKIKNYIYLPICKSPAVLRLDLKDDNVKIYRVGDSGHSSIATDGNNIWLSPRRDGGIVKWDPISNKEEIYDKFPTNYVHGYWGFIKSFCFDGYYWTFPVDGNMVFKVNINNGTIQEHVVFSDILKEEYTENSIANGAFLHCSVHDKKVLLCTMKNPRIILFNLENENIEKDFIMKMPDELLDTYIAEKKKFLLRQKLMSFKNTIESTNNDIATFVNYLKLNKVRSSIIIKKKSTGKNIFKFACKEIVK